MKRGIKTISTLTIVAVFQLFSVGAHAWGNLGHKVIAEIAQRKLNQAARQEIADLLQAAPDRTQLTEGDFDGPDFDEQSVWADHVKFSKHWKHTRSYHYVDIPDGMDYLGSLGGLSADDQSRGDVVLAILRAQDVLRDSNKSRVAKSYALKFMLHFVGDLHQPLHLGRPEDQGGNKIRVRWHGEMTNLHELWDVRMIDSGHASDLQGKSEAAKIQWYADYLSAHKNPNSQCAWDLQDWISTTLAAQHKAYSSYTDNNDAYLRTSLPVIDTQLLAAGEHLACMLNLIFSHAPTSATETEFRSQVSHALKSPLDQFIDLEPQAL